MLMVLSCQASRFPKDSFPALKYLLGRPADDSFALAAQGNLFGSQLVQNERGTLDAQRSDGSLYSVEELIGMQLSHAKDLAEATAKERTLDVVVTVPPFFTQYERQALYDATAVAGLRPLGLVSDGAAGRSCSPWSS